MLLTPSGRNWPKAPVQSRRDLAQTLKSRRAAMGPITAGGILQGPAGNLLHCTDSNRPQAVIPRRRLIFCLRVRCGGMFPLAPEWRIKTQFL
jgi:hypothetical protein